MSNANETDLLLFNCSNLDWRPIFPYAFVQVSEVARRYGLRVQPIDMLDIDRREWPALIQRLLDRYRPRMIGLHLRQGDTLVYEDYCLDSAQHRKRDYFPVLDSKLLIEEVRKLSTIPIMIGGFGFTTHATALTSFLQPDYGLLGEPDDFFRKFETVAAGHSLADVSNLIYTNGTQPVFNRREYFPPADECEYTDGIIEEMVRFYGHRKLFGRDQPTVAVEVMRGCPFSCYFCTEPQVKGKTVRYRNFDVVAEEVTRLVERGIRNLWFICSELIIHGKRFMIQLAEMMLRKKEKYPGLPISWTGYMLPKCDRPVFELLIRSGYVPALNDILSFDDDNLRAAKVPYRKQHAVNFVRNIFSVVEQYQVAAPDTSEVRQGIRPIGIPRENLRLLQVFLGNAFILPDTIAKTIEELHRHKLDAEFLDARATICSRVFPTGEPYCTPKQIFSFQRGDDVVPGLLSPSFSFSPVLIKHLGSAPEVIRFFEYVEQTFLSQAYRRSRSPADFLSKTITPLGLRRLLELAPDTLHPSREISAAAAELLASVMQDVSMAESTWQRLFPPALQKVDLDQLAEEMIHMLLACYRHSITPILVQLGIPAGDDGLPDISPYYFCKAVHWRFQTRSEFDLHILQSLETRHQCFASFLSDWLKYEFNLVWRDGYKELLFRFTAPGPNPSGNSAVAPECDEASTQPTAMDITCN